MRTHIFRPTVLALVLFATTGAAQDNPSRFRVTGEATVVVPAELAEVSVGVDTRSDNLDAAVSANSKAIQDVMRKMREAGIAEVDIQTLNFQIAEPISYSDDDTPPPPKYFVSNSLEVTVRDLDSLGAILSAMTSGGANSIDDLSFGVNDRAPHVAEARRLAVKDARDKASLYAEAAGVTLGRLVDFTEGKALSYETAGYVEEPEVIVEEPVSVPIGAAEVSFRESVTLIYELAE